jgi:hypothetical protein
MSVYVIFCRVDYLRCRCAVPTSGVGGCDVSYFDAGTKIRITMKEVELLSCCSVSVEFDL